MIIAQQRSKLISLLVASVVVLGAIVFSWLSPQPITNAADMSKFEAGNIMSDAVMSNRNSMTVQQIQTFLDSKNACNNTDIHKAAWYPTVSYSIKDGKFVCMAKESFNGESAAQIIWQAGQDYNINPQVLIVLLEKEQGLITDTWPNSRQYQTATGYGCPDTAPCDAQYYGLKNQLRKAANLFRTVLNGGWSNYPVGNVYIQYNPSASCGGSVVNIKNRATSALYRYTPYQPNQSALNAGYGTGDSCGAYGNRNFWLLFTDWFGSTTNEVPVHGSILSYYSKLGGYYGPLGFPLQEERKTVRDGNYQRFENGYILGKWDTGYWETWGSIRKYYDTLGNEKGILGFPLQEERKTVRDGNYQRFENGYILGKWDTGYWENSGEIRGYYDSINNERGVLGFPIGPIQTSAAGYTYQEYEKGYIIGKDGLYSHKLGTYKELN